MSKKQKQVNYFESGRRACIKVLESQMKNLRNYVLLKMNQGNLFEKGAIPTEEKAKLQRQYKALDRLKNEVTYFKGGDR